MKFNYNERDKNIWCYLLLRQVKDSPALDPGIWLWDHLHAKHEQRPQWLGMRLWRQNMRDALYNLRKKKYQNSATGACNLHIYADLP